MSDVSLVELGNKTPLQVANHPNMDWLASRGKTGLLKTIPKKCNPGTEVAFFSIFGLDSRKTIPRRGPLEAAGIGVNLQEKDMALRCNLVTIENEIIKDHSAGHISTEEGISLLKTIKDKFEVSGLIEFFPGISYRHLIILRENNNSENIKSFPPHEIINKPVKDNLIKPCNEMGVSTAELLNNIILNSRRILEKHPVNLNRLKEKRNPANMIWPWGQGSRPRIKTLYEMYQINGAVISAVDIVNGIGRYLGMNIIKTPGATGFSDTNYEGKADYAIKSLKDHDMVLIHVEAPDEASHIGDYDLKVKTIEDLDKRLLGRLLSKIDDDYTISVMTDHGTNTQDGTHSSDPVPFTIYSPQKSKYSRSLYFDELSFKHGSLGLVEGLGFMKLFLNYGKN